MDLKGALIKNKPREVSGSSSSNRFQFQKDWALCKLLEMQLNDEEYVLILDFHEDILIIDSNVDPKIAKFYQIKTKKGDSWTLSDLIYSKNGGNSIMGKLYYNKLTFPSHDIELNFVTNAHYKLKLKNETNPNASIHCKDICINQIEDTSLKKIVEKVKQEFNLNSDPDFKNITYLRVCEAGIESHTTYTQGKLVEYFDAIDPNNKVNSAAAYRMLSKELEKRNDYEWKIQSFDEMISYKGVTKEIFSKFLEDLLKHSQVYNDWQHIENNLVNSGMGINALKKIRQKWRDYDIERLHVDNHLLQEIRHRVIELVKQHDDFNSYKDLMDTVFLEYKKKYDINSVLYDENYIKAIILMEFCLC